MLHNINPYRRYTLSINSFRSLHPIDKTQFEGSGAWIVHPLALRPLLSARSTGQRKYDDKQGSEMTDNNIGIWKARLWEPIVPSADPNLLDNSESQRFQEISYPSQQTISLLKASCFNSLPEHPSLVLRRLGNLGGPSWIMDDRRW